MKEKFGYKTWWLVFLMGALSLSLVSCSGKSSTQLTESVECSDAELGGSVGTYIVSVNALGGSNEYEITIEVISSYENAILRAAMGNGKNQYKVVLPEFVVSPGDLITISDVSLEDLEKFDVLALRFYESNAGGNFLQGSIPDAVQCDLYIPGDGISQSY